LKPEHSDCFDIGVETALDRSGVQILQLTYFNIDTRDRILPNAMYFPVNVHEAQSMGVEGRYNVHLPWNALNIFADVTMNDAVRHNNTNPADSTDGKQLLYIPKYVGTFGFSILVSDISFNMTHKISSERFIKEDESLSLSKYSLTDINLSTSLKLNLLRLNIRAEISNIFNNDYQVLPDYPMPGRTLRMTIGIDY
jgi:vitamin B12 transporter